MLYYVGSVYTSAWYGYFGIDLNLLGLSTPDLLRRSVSPTLWPVVLTLVGLLVLLAARRLPMALARRTRHEQRVLRIWYFTTLGLGAVVLAVPPLIRLTAYPSWAPWSPYVVPGALVIGSLLLCYATTLYASNADLWRRPRSPGDPAPAPVEAAHANTVTIMVALFVLGLSGMIWGIGSYASGQGVDDARMLARYGFPDEPSILIFSVDRLGIEGTGTQVDELDVPGEKYRFYYSGVRLLDLTADAYIVIPQQWQARRDRVFVIPRADTIRIDISTTRNDH
ncbi:hypothetical protein ACTD5D_21265 [Nocardia takedensis]|uniref:hypothetical protein n=1 Tax=Nocardia takedensis TaxID=259390 RepID=UPI003F774D89